MHIRVQECYSRTFRKLPASTAIIFYNNPKEILLQFFYENPKVILLQFFYENPNVILLQFLNQNSYQKCYDIF